jgi:hypothetical protein
MGQDRPKTHDKTKKVAEDRNSFRDDPSKDPQPQSDTDPGAYSNQVALVHAVSTTEKTDIDVFEGDVAVDHAGDNDLAFVSTGYVRPFNSQLTVGKAMP